jgi:iodotyrosine deiodinase
MKKQWPFEPLVFDEKPSEKMLQAASSFYEKLSKRRTVREFSDRPVPKEIIENAIRAAGTAPSGANMQPWHFVAVSSQEIKHQIRDAAEIEEKEFYDHRASKEWLKALEPLGTDEHKDFLTSAPWLIIVFLKKFTYDENGNRFKNYYTTESVGISCGFLLSALHWSGLATLTHTPSPMKFLSKLLNRSKDERAYMIIVAGYPREDATVPVIEKENLNAITTFIE